MQGAGNRTACNGLAPSQANTLWGWTSNGGDSFWATESVSGRRVRVPCARRRYTDAHGHSTPCSSSGVNFHCQERSLRMAESTSSPNVGGSIQGSSHICGDREMANRVGCPGQSGRQIIGPSRGVRTVTNVQISGDRTMPPPPAPVLQRPAQPGSRGQPAADSTPVFVATETDRRRCASDVRLCTRSP